jgi:hypothetical protein
MFNDIEQRFVALQTEHSALTVEKNTLAVKIKESGAWRDVLG